VAGPRDPSHRIAGGWHFLWKDGGWHVVDWLLDEGGTAIATSLAAALVLWTVARMAGGRGSIIALWRGVAFAIAPIFLGVLRFGLSSSGLRSRFRSMCGPLQRLRPSGSASGCWMTPVLLYAAFFVYYAAFID
jgi:hypothetical protein